MPSNRRVYLIDTSKRCEPNGFLLNQTLAFLQTNGYEMCDELDAADTILINSCCVTKDKLDLAEQAIARARPHVGQKRVVLLGCVASMSPTPVDRAGLICIGPKELHRLNDIFAHQTPFAGHAVGSLAVGTFKPYQSALRRENSYLLIGQGCVYACSYCNIKLAKGHIQSTPIADLVAEVRAGLTAGGTELTLLADDCGSYGRDLGTDLAALVEALTTIDERVRIKIGYLYPGALVEMFERLEPALRSGRVTYLNVPLQSGAQRVVELMRRRYQVDEVLALVDEIRAMPRPPWLYTHMLVGFPSETRAELALSFAAVRHFDEAMFIGYSDNPLTAAATLTGKIDAEEIDARLHLAEEALRATGSGSGIVVDLKRVVAVGPRPTP